MKYEVNNNSVSTSPFLLYSKTNLKANTIKKEFNCAMTNEETRCLTGVVAKTRALFESNQNLANYSTPQNVKTKINFKTFSSVQVPKVKTSISIAVENESDKENSIKPILRNKNDYSKIRFSEPRPDSTLIKKSYSSNRISTCVDEQEMKPRGRLHSANIVINKSEEISKEFNIPLSVKQAKACFESLAQNSHSSVPTPKQTSPKFIKTRVDPVQSSRHPGGFTPVKASIL